MTYNLVRLNEVLETRYRPPLVVQHGDTHVPAKVLQWSDSSCGFGSGFGRPLNAVRWDSDALPPWVTSTTEHGSLTVRQPVYLDLADPEAEAIAYQMVRDWMTGASSEAVVELMTAALSTLATIGSSTPHATLHAILTEIVEATNLDRFSLSPNEDPDDAPADAVDP